jgi:hypothetical protein
MATGRVATHSRSGQNRRYEGEHRASNQTFDYRGRHRAEDKGRAVNRPVRTRSGQGARATLNKRTSVGVTSGFMAKLKNLWWSGGKR